MRKGLIQVAACFTALLGVWMIVFVSSASLSGSMPETAPGADEACGTLVVAPDGPAPFHTASTRVILAVDEEWQALFGADSPATARALLANASALFRNVHIHLLPVRVSEWHSPDDIDSAKELLATIEREVELSDADIVIALTGQALNGADGLARRGGRVLVVEHHPRQIEKDAFVLAHEVAHLFGASHACDLTDREGLMAKNGFADADLICPCTQRILEANAARFHAEIEAPGSEPR